VTPASRATRVRAATPVPSRPSAPVALLPLGSALAQVQWLDAQPRVPEAQIAAALRAFHRSRRGAASSAVVTRLICAMRPSIGANYQRLRAAKVKDTDAAQAVMDRVVDVIGLMPRRLVDVHAFIHYASITINASYARYMTEMGRQERLTEPGTPTVTQAMPSEHLMRPERPDAQADAPTEEVKSTIHENLVAFLATAIPRALPDAKHQAIMQRVFRLPPYAHASPVGSDAELAAAFSVTAKTIGNVRRQLRDYIRLTCDSTAL
jgi:hypothetical protein